jgi:hypothetical protein
MKKRGHGDAKPVCTAVKRFTEGWAPFSLRAGTRARRFDAS